MALQVWLPLNGNLNNQGVADVTVTNNGATVDNNGKIGKCYSFNGSSNYIQITIPSTMTTILNTTVAAWVKSTGSVVALGGISNDGDYRNAMVTLYTSGWQFAGGSTYKYISGGSIANSGVWHHVACTVTDTTITTYLDGAQVATNTLSALGVTVTNITSANFIEIGCDHPGGNEFLTGCVNDFRIYDHALSPKEIEILSRGLVAHYPLNNNGGGQPNLYDFESVASKWKTGSEELIFVDATDDVYGNVLKIIVDSVRIYRGVKNVWKADTNFTVSFLAKASKTAVLKIERGRTDYAPDVTVGTTWKRYSTVISCTATTTGGALGIINDTAGADIYLTQIKVELGDKATAYCPGAGDSHYIPLGYDSTTEYDVSGNGYNGTKNGTFAYDTDTARYSVSTIFKNASSNYITLSPINVNMTQVSFSVWFKINSAQKWARIFDFGTAAEGAGYSFGLALGNNGTTLTVYGRRGSSSATLPDKQVQSISLNTWYHAVVTLSNTTLKCYINGTLVIDTTITAAYPSFVAFTLCYLGKSIFSADKLLDGTVSDFRAYATALSAAQVAELYNTAVSVANNGTLMGYELVES